jgi:hypothetical protein
MAEEGEETLAVAAKKGSGLRSCKLLKLGRKDISLLGRKKRPIVSGGL